MPKKGGGLNWDTEFAVTEFPSHPMQPFLPGKTMEKTATTYLTW